MSQSTRRVTIVLTIEFELSRYRVVSVSEEVHHEYPSILALNARYAIVRRKTRTAEHQLAQTDRGPLFFDLFLTTGFADRCPKRLGPFSNAKFVQQHRVSPNTLKNHLSRRGSISARFSHVNSPRGRPGRDHL